MVGVLMSMPHIDIVITNTNHMFIHTILASFVRWWMGECNFWLDICSFDWEKDKEKIVKICKYPDVVITPTRAMQGLLKLKGVRSNVLYTEFSILKGHKSTHINEKPKVAILYDETCPTINISSKFIPVYFGPADHPMNDPNFVPLESPRLIEFLQDCKYGLVLNGSPRIIDISPDVFFMKECGLILIALKKGCISEVVEYLVDSKDQFSLKLEELEFKRKSV